VQIVTRDGLPHMAVIFYMITHSWQLSVKTVVKYATNGTFPFP
jgi:hypothetical protein